MTTKKIALGVCLGILLAGGIVLAFIGVGKGFTAIEEGAYRREVNDSDTQLRDLSPADLRARCGKPTSDELSLGKYDGPTPASLVDQGPRAGDFERTLIYPGVGSDHSFVWIARDGDGKWHTMQGGDIDSVLYRGEIASVHSELPCAFGEQQHP
jgi:hypothetical protein